MLPMMNLKQLIQAYWQKRMITEQLSTFPQKCSAEYSITVALTMEGVSMEDGGNRSLVSGDHSLQLTTV